MSTFRKFKIKKDYLNIGEDMYTNDIITITPGITVFVGANGSGKSTLLRQIKNQLDDRSNTLYLYYDHHDATVNDDPYNNILKDYKNELTRENTKKIKDMVYSEGEYGYLYLKDLFDGCLDLIARLYNNDLKYGFVIIDGLNSSISYDKISSAKEVLHTMIHTAKDLCNLDLYVLIATNDYAWMENEKCMCVSDFHTYNFNNYDSYKYYIIRSSRKVNEREGKLTKLENQNG
jgi:energy-coupling factor transporter ATP-binding protein EcfA2